MKCVMPNFFSVTAAFARRRTLNRRLSLSDKLPPASAQSTPRARSRRPFAQTPERVVLPVAAVRPHPLGPRAPDRTPLSDARSEIFHLSTRFRERPLPIAYMVAGAASAMSPASLLSAAARRSARHASSSAFAASRAAVHRPVPAACAGGIPAVARRPLVAAARPTPTPNPHRALRGVAAQAIADATADDQIDVDATADVDATRGPPQVHSLEGHLAVLTGVGGDVKPGTLLELGANGATGILLAHREPKTFALMYALGADPSGSGAPGFGAGDASVSPGDAVSVLKKKSFRLPSDADVVGRRVGALGQPLDGGDAPGGADRDVSSGPGSEMMREPPSVENRKPITTPLVTGVPSLDALTPVGRGQCMLLTGEPGTALDVLGLNALTAQTANGSGVRCVYGAVGASAADAGAGVEAALRAAGAMDRATVVSCAPDASVAERYAATCAAFAVAEAAREKGEDVLLVLDDFTGLVGFPGEMARLSPQLEMKDATEEEMVEYEGMIINALLAERRRFLGMTLQRVARMNDELGGGSLTLLGVMYHERGAYKGRRGDAKNSGAVGEIAGAGATPGLPAGFDDMTPEMQAKIKAALEKRAAAAEEAAKAAAEASSAAEGFPEEAHVQSRAVVEEFMSITDGQVMVESFSPETGWGISVKDSVSRIGSPGAAGPLMSLDMLQLRLDVMQADDMTVFGREGDEKSKMRDRSAAIRGLLRQRPGDAASLSEQTVGLYALQKGHLRGMNADEAAEAVKKAVARAREVAKETMDDIDAHPGRKLSADVLAKLAAVFA